MAQFLSAIDDGLSAVCAWFGRGVAWLTLLMVGLTFVIVVMRYGFGFGRIYLQESVTYLHAIVFMLAAAWTLRLNGHVRVDVLYRRCSGRTQVWIDLAGTLLLLLPTALLLFWLSFDYASKAWLLGEVSRETGGVPFLYLLKAVIPLTAALLILQGVADLLRCIGRLGKARE